MSSPEKHQGLPQPTLITNLANNILTVKSNSLLPLELITSDKYLGVHLDNKLNFNSHITESTKKATKLLNLCRRNLYMCPQNIKETANKTIVPPISSMHPQLGPPIPRTISIKLNPSKKEQPVLYLETIVMK